MYGNIPKGKCGGAFYFVVIVQRKKKNQKQKEGKIPKIELFSCIIFNKRLEENKKVVSGIA